MCGSGTTEDVANRMGIISHCYDLNRGFDLLSMDIPEVNNYIFWHPPYGDMIQYAGSQYSAAEVQQKYGIDPIQSDLSQIKDWNKFVEAMNFCMMKQFNSLETGGRIAVLMGDMKRRGKLYSMLVDIAKPGTLEQIIIKEQHNCVSSRTNYSGSFIPICHEYLMIVRKDIPQYFEVKLTKSYQVDVRHLRCASWKDVLYAVMANRQAPMSLKDIYNEVEESRKARENQHWQAKVRQTLQMHPQLFRHVERGVWAVAG